MIKQIFPTARKLLVHRSLQQLELPQKKRVLVVGAGSDPYRSLFGDPQLYVCLDVVRHEGVTALIGDAHKLPFSEESFDIVLASEVVEHLVDPRQFAAEAFRVLAPKGELIITVPFMFHRHADPYDYWRPTEDMLTQLLFNFSDITVNAQGNRIHTISDLITTAFSPRPILFPLRIINHLLARLPSIPFFRKSTAPSGYLVIAKK